MLIETEKWQFPFLPWLPTGLGCWERHTAPLLFSKCGLAKAQKRLCWSAEGSMAAIMAGTFGHPGELSGEDLGREEERPLTFSPIFLAFLLPSLCPVSSPALSLVRRLRQSFIHAKGLGEEKGLNHTKCTSHSPDIGHLSSTPTYCVLEPAAVLVLAPETQGPKGSLCLSGPVTHCQGKLQKVR